MYIYNHRLAFIAITLAFHGIIGTVSQLLVNTGNFQHDAGARKPPFYGNWQLTNIASRTQFAAVNFGRDLNTRNIGQVKARRPPADDVEKSRESEFFFLIRHISAFQIFFEFNYEVDLQMYFKIFQYICLFCKNFKNYQKELFLSIHLYNNHRIFMQSCCMCIYC